MSREAAKEEKEIEDHADPQSENGDASLKLWSDSKETMEEVFPEMICRNYRELVLILMVLISTFISSQKNAIY